MEGMRLRLSRIIIITRCTTIIIIRGIIITISGQRIIIRVIVVAVAMVAILCSVSNCRTCPVLGAAEMGRMRASRRRRRALENESE